MLKDQVALITGASRGIGKAIALELAKQGANIVLNYAGNKEAALETKKEIEQYGVNVLVVKGNVSESADVEELFKQTIETFGKVDILINNAGITRDGLMMRMKEQDWDDVINTNLKGVFLCSKAAAKWMFKQRSGKIVNISSVVGLTGNPGQVNYVAAKAGVIGMTKTMAKEFASRHITVNAVAPGFIETDMTHVLKEEVKTELLKSIPLGALGQSEDIAKTVKFLVSDDAKYITGQTISVDGGMYL